MHLPSASSEVKNPYKRKNAGTLEHYRTINKILITFSDKTQWNQWVSVGLYCSLFFSYCSKKLKTQNITRPTA